MNALAWAAALALTLVLGAFLTPGTWWRRPNLRALAFTAGGTLALGSLFGAWTGAPAPAAAPLALAAPVEQQRRPATGASYRVIEGLNLRENTGTGAARLQVLAAGTVVSTTGAVDGDWWRVRARVDGEAVEGWASSLWLRRADERREH
jgi:hypothetical protein